jgi:SAM-dependent methyltransferase
MLKSKAKALLAKLYLLETARFLWSFFKGASPQLLAREFVLRIGGSQDRLPLPSAQMMYQVISTRWAATFLDSGDTIVSAIESALRSTGTSLVNFHAILDFGCGCGRLIRHLPKFTNAALFGCDYNPELVTWCAKNLPIGTFTTNSLQPPLPYPDRSFDFIYARSVFTHLSEQGQAEWLQELARVMKPGGLLYLTMHGEQFFGQLSPEEQDAVRSGGIIVHRAGEEGRNLCTSFELPEYVRTHLPAGFQLLTYIPGIAQEHLQQDGYMFRWEI